MAKAMGIQGPDVPRSGGRGVFLTVASHAVVLIVFVALLVFEVPRHERVLGERLPVFPYARLFIFHASKLARSFGFLLAPALLAVDAAAYAALRRHARTRSLATCGR